MTAAEQPLGKDSLDSLHHDESTDGHKEEEFSSLTSNVSVSPKTQMEMIKQERVGLVFLKILGLVHDEIRHFKYTRRWECQTPNLILLF